VFYHHRRFILLAASMLILVTAPSIAGLLPDLQEIGAVSRAEHDELPLDLPERPETPSGFTPDVDASLAVAVAEARARWQWPEAIRVGAPIAVLGPDGTIVAWDVDFVLDTGAPRTSIEIADAWRTVCLGTMDDRRARSRFGRVTVAANHADPPFLGVGDGPSSWLAAGWLAQAIARRALGPEARLTRILAAGNWERLFEFEAGGRRILVQGFEPWGWYDADVALPAMRALEQTREAEARQQIIAAGQDPDDLRRASRRTHERAMESWLRRGVRSRSPVYIYGHDTHFEPYFWFGGCAPTSGSMVLNYYDAVQTYGWLTNRYSWETDPVTGDDQCHVSDMSPVMRDFMNTDDEGWTSRGDVYPGMVDYAAGRGYVFGDGIEQYNSILNWGWDDAVAEINANRPFTWACDFAPYAQHRVAVVGYDGGPSPGEFGCYNTWSYGNVVEWVPHSGGVLDQTHMAGPHPISSPEDHNAHLLEPDGNQGFVDCLPLPAYHEGNELIITWDNHGNPADRVGLWYTLNAEEPYQMITHDTPDDGLYVWTVPCDLESYWVRVKVMQFDASGQLQGSDTSRGDFQLVRLPDLAVSQAPEFSDDAPCAGAPITVSWAPVAGAVEYTLHRDGQAIWSGPTPEVGISAASGQYRVSASNACRYGPPGPASSLAAIPPLPAPAYLAIDPPDGACEGELVTISWLPVDGADLYGIWLDGVLVWQGVETSLVAPAQNGTIAVAASGDCGWGEQSSPLSYTVFNEPPPPADVIVAPGTPCPGDDVTVNWTATDDASIYSVRIDGIEHWSGAEPPAVFAAVAGEYRVFAWNECGWSSGSEPRIVAIGAEPVAPEAPDMQPNPAGLYDPVVVSWPAVDAATWYRLYLDGVPLMQVAQTTVTLQPPNISGDYAVQAGSPCGESGLGPATHLDVTAQGFDTPCDVHVYGPDGQCASPYLGDMVLFTAVFAVERDHYSFGGGFVASGECGLHESGGGYHYPVGTEVLIRGIIQANEYGEGYLQTIQLTYGGVVAEPEPQVLALAEVLTDHGHVASLVDVEGNVTQAGSTSFTLHDPAGDLEVRSDPFVGLSLIDVEIGDRYRAAGILRIENGDLVLYPRSQDDLEELEPVGVEDELAGLTGPRLDLPYPNPFNPQVRLSFLLPEPAATSLCVYDVSGRRVRTLVARTVLGAGRHDRLWNARNEAGRAVPSGVYFGVLEAADTRQIRRLVLTR
jgi:hypothetical protein